MAVFKYFLYLCVCALVSHMFPVPYRDKCLGVQCSVTLLV